ncbi:hypothetical protein D3C81_992200 [compost metagenome]
MDIVRVTQVPRPSHFAGDRIVATNHTRWSILILTITDLRAGDYNTVHNGRRRRHRVPARDLFAQTFPEIDSAVLAKVLAGLTGAEVDCYQPGIQGGFNHSAAALCRFG